MLNKSIAGKIEWEALSATSFITRLGGLIVEVAKVQSNTVLRVRNDNGIVETTSYSDLPSPEDQRLLELFEVARRSGLQIDKALGSLKSALDSL